MKYADCAVQRCAEHAGYIGLHDPDPHYTGHCFAEYLRAADAAVDGIFVAAGADFGLSLGRPATRDSFAQGIRHGDILASEFLKWYDDQYQHQWHSGTYPHMMMMARDMARATGQAPEIRIMIRAEDRYRDDPIYDIDTTGLVSNGRLCSRDGLLARVRYMTPIFLELVNHKRRQKGEPRVSGKGVVASAFAVIHAGGHAGKPCAPPPPPSPQSSPPVLMELAYAAEVYVQVIQRMRSESASYIRGLITSAASSARIQISDSGA